MKLRWYDKRCWNNFLNKLIPYITLATIVVIVVVLVIFLVHLIGCVCLCGWQAFMTEHPGGNALCILLPLLVAAIVLKKTNNIQSVESLAKLRTMLNSNDKLEIHKQLIEEARRDECLSVSELDYIGTIELGAIMHRKGLLSDQELYNQFGYRVENIAKSSLFAKLEQDKLYYKDFFYIKDIVEKISRKK